MDYTLPWLHCRRCYYYRIRRSEGDCVQEHWSWGTAHSLGINLENQILEMTKACEQRLSFVHHVWTMHRGILWSIIFSTYVYWLLTCLLESTYLICCVFKPSVSNYSRVHLLLSLTVRGEVLWSSTRFSSHGHIARALGSVGHRKLENSKPKALGWISV